MERLDREVQSFLKGGLENVKLSAKQKQSLQLAIAKELTVRQVSWWRRIIIIINRFMETTFEIPVAPVAVAVCSVMLVGAGMLVFNSGTEPGQAPNQIVYIQQAVAGSDGSLQITYIPVHKEGF
ncbi:MAG: hypothetical protein VR67_06755 [Peptococcaceae bacterium BRH_c8a]|nr:MAG: hypothetical protein VR67_06755 [Peptococcaceae bacterium BRH_c8a]